MRIRHRAAVLTAVSCIALTGFSAAGSAAMAATAAARPAASTSATTKALSVQGTLSALNTAKSTLTVAGDDGTTIAVNVDPKATIKIDGDTAKLAKLPVGARLKLTGTTANGVNVATGVEASTVLPFVSLGSVTSVDTAAATITVRQLSLSSRTGSATYPVADKAAITLDGRKVTLDKLPAKARVLITGTVTNGTAYSARTLRALSRWELNLSGTVSAVDAANGTVTVTTGSPATDVKLAVDPKASVRVNGVKVSLDKLPIGATVALTGSETTTSASVTGIDAKVNSKRS